MPIPLTEIDMYNNIIAYVDRIMKLVKPKKILFMAIGKHKKIIILQS